MFANRLLMQAGTPWHMYFDERQWKCLIKQIEIMQCYFPQSSPPSCSRIHNSLFVYTIQIQLDRNQLDNKLTSWPEILAQRHISKQIRRRFVARGRCRRSSTRPRRWHLESSRRHCSVRRCRRTSFRGGRCIAHGKGQPEKYQNDLWTIKP